MAAGFPGVWSTTKLLTMRGSLSSTKPLVWAYEVRSPQSGGVPGPLMSPIGPGMVEQATSAVRNSVLTKRRNTSSAAPKVSWPGTRLLQMPETVRRPKGS